MTVCRRIVSSSLLLSVHSWHIHCNRNRRKGIPSDSDTARKANRSMKIKPSEIRATDATKI